MTIKTLYSYLRDDGGISSSLNKPNTEYTESVRIIADKDKAVTLDGKKLYTVIDTDSAEGFYEVDRPSVAEKMRAIRPRPN